MAPTNQEEWDVIKLKDEFREFIKWKFRKEAGEGVWRDGRQVDACVHYGMSAQQISSFISHKQSEYPTQQMRADMGCYKKETQFGHYEDGRYWRNKKQP